MGRIMMEALLQLLRVPQTPSTARFALLRLKHIPQGTGTQNFRRLCYCRTWAGPQIYPGSKPELVCIS